MCVCVCVCVGERERERERDKRVINSLFNNMVIKDDLVKMFS
jgi:hypothetical protein